MWAITILPYLIEVIYEAYMEKVRKVSVGHTWTMIIRIALMILIGFVLKWIGQTDYWWQGTALSLGIFIALFNYTYNLLTGRKLLYLRSKGIDKLYGYVPPWGRIIWELIILGSSITVYLNPNVII